jgi:cytochrome c oxidase subunit II
MNAIRNALNFPMTPPSASNFAPEYDLIFWALTALTAIFTVLVMTLVLFFSIKYRAGNRVDRSRPIYENLKMELTWTIIPLILGLFMFFFGARIFIEMRNPPEEAQEVFVIGKQWMWHIQHANGVRENNTLHVPLGQPIKVTMISQDVLHGFYIPAFRVQMHVVPGRYTQMWFTPTRVGEYHLFCTNYCGTQHSEMGGKVVVMEPSQWAEWVANGGERVPQMSMAQHGARLFMQVGCNNCHGGEDTPRAPTLAGLFSQRRTTADGTTATADEGYLREAILRPHNRITAGYDATMPVYEGQLTEEQVMQLIAFIRGGGVATSTPAVPSSSIANEIGGGMPTNSAESRNRAAPSVGAIRHEGVGQ